MFLNIEISCKSVEEEHPLKQGLKHYRTHLVRLSKVVEEEHPLKQGLKLPYLTAYSSISFLVEEEHPLKQGLKLRLSM